MYISIRMRNIGIDTRTSIWLCISPKTLRSKNRVAFTFAYYRFILSTCGRWYLSHVSTRNVSCAIYKTRRPTYRSWFYGRDRPCIALRRARC